MSCQLCPRKCDVDRAVTAGFCGTTDACTIARISLHPYEEPCISGSHGSGTIFFSGCNLKCVFCQNAAIRDGQIGAPYSVEMLADAMLDLQEQGAHNINLVTPTPHLRAIIPAIIRAKSHGLVVPILYNTSAYENVEAIDMLDGLVDVYLPDLKFHNSELARRFAHAEDYFSVSVAAITRMWQQVGQLAIAADGTVQRGLLIRHLVLPNCVFDTREILHQIAEHFSVHCYLSVMRQYTPPCAELPAPLNRTVTEREYRSVTEQLLLLGFDHVYLQEASSVGFSYTPAFSKDAPINSLEYMS